MALKALITESEFESLAEHYREDYVEHDGSYILQVTPVGGVALEDVSGLKKSMSDWKDKASKLRRDRDKWGDVLTDDLTPEKVAEALSKVGEMDDWDPEKKNAEYLERERKKMEEALAKEIDKNTKTFGNEIQSRDERIKAITGQLIGNMKAAARAQALAEHGGDPYLLGPLLDSRMRPLTDDGGNITGMGIVGDDGEIMKTGPLNKETMTPSDFISSLRDDERYQPAFSATRASGSGARGSEAGGGRNGAAFRVKDLEQLSQAEYEAKRAEQQKTGLPLQFR